MAQAIYKALDEETEDAEYLLSVNGINSTDILEGKPELWTQMVYDVENQEYLVSEELNEGRKSEARQNIDLYAETRGVETPHYRENTEITDQEFEELVSQVMGNEVKLSQPTTRTNITAPKGFKPREDDLKWR